MGGEGMRSENENEDGFIISMLVVAMVRISAVEDRSESK